MKERATRTIERGSDLETIRSLCEKGFQVIVYGGRDDPALRDAAFTEESPVVILDRGTEVEIQRRKIALLTSGTEEDEEFARFVDRFVAENLAGIYELRIIRGDHWARVPEVETSHQSSRTTGAMSRRKPA